MSLSARLCAFPFVGQRLSPDFGAPEETSLAALPSLLTQLGGRTVSIEPITATSPFHNPVASLVPKRLTVLLLSSHIAQTGGLTAGNKPIQVTFPPH